MNIHTNIYISDFVLRTKIGSVQSVLMGCGMTGSKTKLGIAGTYYYLFNRIKNSIRSKLCAQEVLAVYFTPIDITIIFKRSFFQVVFTISNGMISNEIFSDILYTQIRLLGSNIFQTNTFRWNFYLPTTYYKLNTPSIGRISGNVGPMCIG